MMQRGRKSAASLSVIALETVPRLRVPSGLTKAEEDLFRLIVGQCAADHFVPSDGPLALAYMQPVLLSRSAFRQVTEAGIGVQTWQQAARTMASLATNLRLCPHSRSDPKTIGRHQRDFIGPSAYDLMRL